ncbi:cell wall mannoprotein 1 family protein [Aspergillus undulatus]|uniref:cell wall mannoprotein 1 family protein n=1 Tax=Aspergillus undulatus TaxID=1810928 RepID=UPI003CCCFC23
MKFLTTLLTLTLFSSTFAAPAQKEKRALADYQNVFTGISDQVAVVSSTVSSYVSASVPGADVQSAANELVTIINNGAASIATFDALSNLDALALVSPIRDLSSDVGDLVDAVIAAEPNFEGDGLAADVLGLLEAQKAATEALTNAMTPKVPAALQNIAAELAGGIIAEIERGIAAYSD